jgi:hypothetical protein
LRRDTRGDEWRMADGGEKERVEEGEGRGNEEWGKLTVPPPLPLL